MITDSITFRLLLDVKRSAPMNALDLRRTVIVLMKEGINPYTETGASRLLSAIEILDKIFKEKSVQELDSWAPKFDPRLFIAHVYELWRGKLRKRSLGARTVLYLEKRLRDQVPSAYHRITGRLRLEKSYFFHLLNFFLSEWEADNSPYPNYDEEIVRMFTNEVFGDNDLVVAAERRLNEIGLTEDDFQLLVQIHNLLDRPIKLDEIVPILRVAHKIKPAE